MSLTVKDRVKMLESFLDRVMTNDSKIAEVSNHYFSNIVPDLGLKIPDALMNHSPKNYTDDLE